MIAAFAKVNLKPGKKEKLIEFLKWDVEVSRNEPATLRFDVFEDSNNDSVIYWYEAYGDAAGFETHKQGKPVKKLLDGGLWGECIVSVEPAMSADINITALRSVLTVDI